MRRSTFAPLFGSLWILMACVAPARGAEPAPDALDDALAIAGLTRVDLGWEARGWWERYPQDIPYKLRHFDDLCAEPLAVVPFTRVMGATVRVTLAPDLVAGKKNDQGAGALYRAVHDLGVNKRYGATRPYSANLTAVPTPLPVALLEAWQAEDRSTKFVTFGAESPYPLIANDLDSACEALPSDVSAVLGKLVLDLLDARAWVRLAFRNVPLETRARIATRLDLGAEETDALDYEPAMDDAAHAWDEASLWYGGLKAVEALDVARLALAGSRHQGRRGSRQAAHRESTRRRGSSSWMEPERRNDRGRRGRAPRRGPRRERSLQRLRRRIAGRPFRSPPRSISPATTRTNRVIARSARG